MSCRNCSSKKTIEAHLIPKVFTKEVTAGSAHAIVAVNDAHGIRPSQRGIFDSGILCEACDNRLGALEQNAAQTSGYGQIRRRESMQSWSGARFWIRRSLFASLSIGCCARTLAKLLKRLSTTRRSLITQCPRKPLGEKSRSDNSPFKPCCRISR